MREAGEWRPWPPGVGDPYGRELEDVRRDVEMATRATTLLDEVIALGRRLTPGREAGERLFKRLEVSRTTIGGIAERDLEIARELAAYLAGELDWIANRQAGTTRLTRKRRWTLRRKRSAICMSQESVAWLAAGVDSKQLASTKG